MDAVYKELVGKTAVKLDGDRPVCRQFECNMGMSTTSFCTHVGYVVVGKCGHVHDHVALFDIIL